MKVNLLNINIKNRENFFWGNNHIFSQDVQFNEIKATDYLKSLNLDEEERCIFLEDFIKFYQQYKISNYYQLWFNKSLELIKKVYGLNAEVIYNYTLHQISHFDKKENFEIFYYFKDIKILHNGYNNIFSELLKWFSDNEEKINKLLQNNEVVPSNHILINGYCIISGVSGKGKSVFLNKKILQGNVFVISKKDMNLKNFSNEDREYFYELFLNLTNEENLHNFFLKIENNKKNFDFKGVALYVEKRLRYEHMLDKLEQKMSKSCLTENKRKKI